MQASPDYTLDMKLAQVNAGSLVNELTSAKNVLPGILTSDLKASGRGLTWPEISTTLTGTGKVQITDLGSLAASFGPSAAFLRDKEGRIPLPFTVKPSRGSSKNVEPGGRHA